MTCYETTTLVDLPENATAAIFDALRQTAGAWIGQKFVQNGIGHSHADSCDDAVLPNLLKQRLLEQFSVRVKRIQFLGGF